MKTVERCQKFAEESLKILEEKGQSLDTAKWISIEAGKITNKLSEKTLQRCQWAGGVLDAKVIVENSIWRRYHFNEPQHQDDWDELKEILEEVAGRREIKTLQREREWWTGHWRYLYQHGDENMKKEVIKTAKKRYEDFDLTLLDRKDD